MGKRSLARRVMIFGGLSLAAGLAGWIIYGTDLGQALQQREVARAWLQRWPGIAPAVFIMGYATMAVLALPVWWMQVIAGYCFGLGLGVVWCLLGDVISTLTSMAMAHWLLGDGLERRTERYREKLQRLHEKLKHNGLLVVMATRLCFVMPFGVSNYLFGLTRLRWIDALVGTVLGGLLTRTVHVTAGVDWRLLTNGWYLLMLLGVGVAVLGPLALGYWRPGWFGRRAT